MDVAVVGKRIVVFCLYRQRRGCCDTRDSSRFKYWGIYRNDLRILNLLICRVGRFCRNVYRNELRFFYLLSGGIIFLACSGFGSVRGFAILADFGLFQVVFFYDHSLCIFCAFCAFCICALVIFAGLLYDVSRRVIFINFFGATSRYIV